MEYKLGLIAIPIAIVISVIMISGNYEVTTESNFQTQEISNIQAPMADAEEQKVREYTLVIEATDIEVSPTAVWHAWTYNGTIPAPTLRVQEGELLRVRVINNHNLTHSFHAHMSNYDPKHDGSPINVITGIGKGSMIPPGGEWTYEYNVDTSGTTFFHDHAASEGLGIKDHILQGLYGTIIIERDPPKTYIDRDIVVVMSEIGHDVERISKGPVPFYLMNGKGVPGGEKALEEIFKEKGIDGVVEQFNKTIPVHYAKAGETVQFHVINLGEQIHSFHLHGHKMISSTNDRGSVITHQTLPLVQGTLETFIINPDKPGIWLFHCHVVGHADAGMIGLFIVEE
jgi:FtsP/CotA-like multicopper oxidase with cupredoxin domain